LTQIATEGSLVTQGPEAKSTGVGKSDADSQLRRTDVLELHVAHACNLACESCSHYSNHGHAGITSLEEADAWMSLWSSRLDTRRFMLLGGEPTIHPDLPAFVPVVRRHWPFAHIKIVTNGFFLHKHPELPAILAADRDAELCLSVHHDSPQYTEKLRSIFVLIAEWRERHSFALHVRQSHANWTRRYLGHGASIRPYEDGRPRQSWEICPARHCKQLFEGKLWKCPALSYLNLQRGKFGLAEQWNPYLGYKALDPGCSNSELDAFLAREDETYCGMCPAQRQPFSLPVPLRTHGNGKS
jgi:hypothetical protein